MLDSHEEAQALIDEIRGRAGTATGAVGDLRSRTWTEIEDWVQGTWSRPVRDYRAAVLKAARFLGLGASRAEAVHELAGRAGYKLKRPIGKAGPPAPAAAVASALGADTTGQESWRSGATANRQARLRYLSTTASLPDRQSPFGVDLDPL